MPRTAASAASMSFFYDGASELTDKMERTSGAWIRRLTVRGSAR